MARASRLPPHSLAADQRRQDDRAVVLDRADEPLDDLVSLIRRARAAITFSVVSSAWISRASADPICSNLLDPGAC